MLNSKIKYVLWDWNGTLLNDVDANLEVIRQMLSERRMDFRCTKEFYRENFCFPVYDFYKIVGFDFEKESFEHAADDYVNWYNRLFYKTTLFENTRNTIKELNEQNIKQVILSASEKKSLDEQVTSFSLSDCFQDILGVSDSLGSGKTGIAENWMKQMDLKPDEIIMIGDTDHDYAVSVALGCRCILICCGHQSRERLLKTGAVIADDIGEIPGLIKGMV